MRSRKGGKLYARLTGAVEEAWLVGVVAEVEEDRLCRARPELQDLVVHRDEGLRVLSRVQVNGSTGPGRTSASLLPNNFILEQNRVHTLIHSVTQHTHL